MATSPRATCPSCGSELTGQYCDTCGARAPEERAPRKKKQAVTQSSRPGHPVRSPGLLAPQRIWRTVAVAAVALLVYGAGILTGVWMTQGSTPASTQGAAPAAASASGDDPAIAAMPALARASYFMEKGVALINEGQRTAAVAEFRRSLKEWDAALKEEPTNLYAQTYQGLTYYYAGDSQNALTTLRAVLDKDPNYLWAIFNLAWIYETGGKKSEAILMYKKYITVAPEEEKNQLKYAEQLELIPTQVEASKKAITRLEGGGSGQ